MGKLKDLASVKSTNASSFAYLPPDSAFDAMRILVKPNLGYAAKPPATVSLHVLDAVLRGLRRASPMGRIVVIEGITSDEGANTVFDELGVIPLLDKEMRITDSDNLIMHEYPNLLPQPLRYASMTASEYIKDYDCVISVGAFKRTIRDGAVQISASLKNIMGIFPRQIYQQDFQQANIDDLLTDIYFTVGHHFDGAVVDLTEKYVSEDSRSDREDNVAYPVGKVVWGDDLLAVDEVACQFANEPIPSYIEDIRQRRKDLASVLKK